MSNRTDSFPSELSRVLGSDNIISVGQRDANTGSQVLEKIASMASGDVIIKGPEIALTNYPSMKLDQPPDYWIAVHRVGSWR